MSDLFGEKQQKVLIVEDDPSILMGVRDALEVEGYLVSTASDGVEGLRLALEEDPDLVLLDVMMPRMSGFEVLKKLRENRIRGSVIMLTAKGEEMDRVKGLRLGADDYVAKPFGIIELVARVEAVLRRTTPREDSLATVRFGRIEVDFNRFEARKDGRPLTLTPREFKILRYFIEHRGKVVSRNELLDKVWGYDVFPTTRTVDNHIVKLRKQIEVNPGKPACILSVRGVGYKFVAPVEGAGGPGDEEGMTHEA